MPEFLHVRIWDNSVKIEMKWSAHQVTRKGDEGPSAYTGVKQHFGEMVTVGGNPPCLEFKFPIELFPRDRHPMAMDLLLLEPRFPDPFAWAYMVLSRTFRVGIQTCVDIRGMHAGLLAV